jgi:hypothetical protein
MTKYSNHIARIRHPAPVGIMVVLMVLLYGVAEIIKNRPLALLLNRINQGLLFATIAPSLWTICRDK